MPTPPPPPAATTPTKTSIKKKKATRKHSGIQNATLDQTAQRQKEKINAAWVASRKTKGTSGHTPKKNHRSPGRRSHKSHRNRSCRLAWFCNQTLNSEVNATLTSLSLSFYLSHPHAPCL
jgi:hypothetical protein